MNITQVKEIQSLKGNKIELLKAENRREGGSVALVIGVFHGDEQEGEYLINKLMKEIKQKPELIENNSILFIPCLNPDGKAENTRSNANNVDINRNFPTKNYIQGCDDEGNTYGDNAASEVETQFIIDILEEYKPNRILTIHSPLKVVNYDGPAEEIADHISKLNGYPTQFDIGYPTPGSFGTYAGKERNIPTITLELPKGVSNEDLWIANQKALHYFISL